MKGWGSRDSGLTGGLDKVLRVVSGSNSPIERGSLPKEAVARYMRFSYARNLSIAQIAHLM